VRLLVDTHLIVWAAEEPERLSATARGCLADPDNELTFSVASLWEVAIKSALGRADFQIDASVLRRGLVENAYTELPVTGDHACAVAILPPIHKDPFDRLLVVQATLEGMTLLTSDAVVARYPGPIRLV